jgi:hypothetical protein
VKAAVHCGIIFGVALGGFFSASGSTADSKTAPPARIENPVKETDLATVTLAPQAEERLGVKTAPVERKKMRVMRQYGGEIIMPMTVDGENAPDFATFSAATAAELLKLADQQAVAEGEVAKAKVLLDAALLTLTRAKQLHGAQASSEREVTDAEALVGVAQKTLETAQQRRALLGASVVKSMSNGHLWVRVPIYVGALARIDTEAPAQIGALDGQPNQEPLLAKPVKAPPSASAASATVDLFYEVEKGNSQLRPGQKVGLSLPLRGEEERLVVPWAAILHDIHGGTWVYENTAPHVFVRRRVQVERVTGNEATLATGPKPDAKVVTDGAAEIFGTEFGAGK